MSCLLLWGLAVFLTLQGEASIGQVWLQSSNSALHNSSNLMTDLTLYPDLRAPYATKLPRLTEWHCGSFTSKASVVASQQIYITYLTQTPCSVTYTHVPGSSHSQYLCQQTRCDPH